MEKLRNVDLVLVADQLTISFFQALSRTLIFNHQNRDAVYKGNNIASFGLGRASAFNRKLRCDVVFIVRWVFPVNVTKRIAFGVARNRLCDRSAKDKVVVDILICAAQAL